MEILYWFKSIQTPLLDVFFSAVTFLGHELIPIALICILYWCVNKRLAYKIGFSFFISGLLTQCLKITFRVERPWVKDPSFKPVGNAIDEATSYSFPSGHTQASTSVYGSLALAVKKNWLRVLCVLAFVIVGVSRMYLGVHTLMDVGVAMASTFLITFAVFKTADRVYDNRKYDVWVSVVMLTISLFTIIYSAILSQKSLISADSLSDCMKSGGAGLAFSAGYFIERRYIDFSTKSDIKLQVLKVIIGLGIALGLKSGLKAILGDTPTSDAIRYFVLVAFIIVIYPMFFKAFASKTTDNNN